MNFRQLIERAMNEARDEFADVIARKLDALIGIDPSNERRLGRPPKDTVPVPATSPRRRTRSGARAGRRRAPPEHMRKIHELVLLAMKPGVPMKKGAIMKEARLGAEEDTRVGTVLAHLKSDGAITMKGVRGSATYILKG
jgi:hypothetical protein